MNLSIQVQRTRWRQLKQMAAINALISESKTIISKLCSIRNQLNKTRKSKHGDTRDQMTKESDLRNQLDRLTDEIKELTMKAASTLPSSPLKKLIIEAYKSQVVRSEQDLCTQDFMVSYSIVKHLEEYVESLTQRILEGLEIEHKTHGGFRPGPVGELPIHQCLLLDLDELATIVIDKYFNSPERISLPYTNDLDPWRRRGSSAQRAWEDGLFTGETALHIAIAKEDVRRVQFLLERGADLSSRATGAFFQPPWLPPLSDKLTPLQQIFAWMGTLKVNTFRFATLTQESNPDSACYYGELPLSFAASVGSVEICRMLFLKRCDLENSRGVGSQSDPSRKPASAVDLWDDDKFKAHNMVRDRDSERWFGCGLWRFVNAVDAFGNTAMHLAVLHGRTHVVDWLMGIEAGRDGLNVVNCLGFTPLTLAARLGNLEMFDHILNRHMSKVVWQYGKVKKKEIDLQQVGDPHDHRTTA
jgi:ankyrin repeat protein